MIVGNSLKNHDMESGYKILKIVLLESHFARIPNVTFNDEKIRQNVNVDVKVDITGNSVVVQEKVDFTQTLDDIEEINCTITMSGIFEKVGASVLDDLEQFGKLNGAAIIFPYIREHLSNLALKAGLGMIILPPMNFSKLQ